MKVKCINQCGWVTDGRKFFFIKLPPKDVKGPEYGDIVTVDDVDYSFGEKYYSLVEWPDDEAIWLASEFVPLQETYEEVKFEQLKIEKPISVN